MNINQNKINLSSSERKIIAMHEANASVDKMAKQFRYSAKTMEFLVKLALKKCQSTVAA